MKKDENMEGCGRRCVCVKTEVHKCFASFDFSFINKHGFHDLLAGFCIYPRAAEVVFYPLYKCRGLGLWNSSGRSNKLNLERGREREVTQDHLKANKKQSSPSSAGRWKA